MESLSEKGIESLTGQKVQRNFRKQISTGRNIKQIVQEVASIPSIRLKGDKENNKFDFKSMYFLCGTVGSLELSNNTCLLLKTSDCQYTLCDFAEARQNEWRKTALERINQVTGCKCLLS